MSKATAIIALTALAFLAWVGSATAAGPQVACQGAFSGWVGGSGRILGVSGKGALVVSWDTGHTGSTRVGPHQIARYDTTCQYYNQVGEAISRTNARRIVLRTSSRTSLASTCSRPPRGGDRLNFVAPARQASPSGVSNQLIRVASVVCLAR